MPLALVALALTAFAIGTTEFAAMGLLPQVAGDLQVSIAQAGWLISAYAVGVVIGAPLLTAAAARLPARPYWSASRHSSPSATCSAPPPRTSGSSPPPG